MRAVSRTFKPPTCTLETYRDRTDFGLGIEGRSAILWVLGEPVDASSESRSPERDPTFLNLRGLPQIEALGVRLLYQWPANEGVTSIRLLLLQQAAEYVKLHGGTTPHGDPMHPWILMDGLDLPASSLEPGQPSYAEPEPDDEPDEIRASWGTLVNLHGVTRIFRQFLQGFKPKCRVAHERE
ncbi:MCM DNA helicase complex subunit [Marasmius sp. AFHP31]|nr:MCM DNA helicase complex subunit [Marasmius sp. AFHP31]